MVDVKTARSPNCDSDHYLVKIKIKDILAAIDNNKSYKRKNGKWKIKETRTVSVMSENIKD
jgi:hypothetical protein